MVNIKTFPFDKHQFQKIKEYHFGTNWPVVYIQENGEEMYIGQTTNAHGRSNEHYRKPDRARLKRIHILTDEEFNVSAALDFESLLIQYVSADGMFSLQNSNGGLVNHNYYDKEKYLAKLEVLWPQLQKMNLVKQEIAEIKNSEFFKYSPYKALTPDQLDVAEQLEINVREGKEETYIVNGGPGTGKSILALYLLKRLSEDDKTKHLKVALVVPQKGLRTTLQKVIRRVPRMSAQMVIGPNDAAKQKYDVLIVDEAHRLRRRVNLSNYGSYDATNRKMGLPKESTQLDWIMSSSNQQILFYDKRQSVVPADLRPTDLENIEAKHYELTSQMRVEGGSNYLNFIDNLLSLQKAEHVTNYDFRMYEDLSQMVNAIKEKDSEYTLARMVAGYAWSWNTKGGKPGHDIEIDGIKLVWNSTNIDWVNSKNAINEVGCIHTIQGYDLNYAGVIIGPELSYDEESDTIIVDEKKYKDINGKRSITNPGELQQYIVNIYKTLMTRGIKGTYIFVVDEKLRKKFSEILSHVEKTPRPQLHKELIPSPISVEMFQVPLVGSAPCGNPLLGEENIEEYIPVPKIKIRPGSKYFIVQADGDSMNLAGINDGDLILCRYGEKGETGDKVVALLDGENVTIKEYGPRIDGIRLLLPKSTNPKHRPITPGEGDSIQGVVQEVLRGPRYQ